MQKATLISETLGETIKVRITPKGLRTVEFMGGLMLICCLHQTLD